MINVICLNFHSWYRQHISTILSTPNFATKSQKTAYYKAYYILKIKA